MNTAVEARVRTTARSRTSTTLNSLPEAADTKTRVTKAEKLINAGELDPAKAAVVAAVSSLDKAAEKGIIHPNNAARRKSRLMKKLNQAQSAGAAPAK